jgi:hypothetical protein
MGTNRAYAATGDPSGAALVFTDDYLSAGDGTASGTAALQKALTDAAGKTLVLGKEKTYVISEMLIAPKNLTLISNGSKFLKRTIGAFGFRTDDGFRADLLHLETPGHATTNDQGVYVLGNDVHIRHLRVVSTQGDTPGLNGVVIGNASAVNTTAMTNVRIDRTEIIGWQRPLRMINVADSCIANIHIRNFISGVYLQNNVSNTNFPRATISGTSPSSAGGPYNGMNGLLIESMMDHNTNGLRFTDWTVEGAPEHSYRIGGTSIIRDIWYTNCVSRNSGNAPGNGSTGGCGFKCLGGSAMTWHENIFYENCIVEDVKINGVGVNNFTAFSFGHTRNVTISNAVVRKRTTSNSCHNGVFLNSVDNVSIVNPTILDCAAIAVYIGKDGTDSSGLGVKNVRIIGGRVQSSRSHALYFDTKTTTTENVFIDNVDIVPSSGGSRALRAEAASSGGVYKRIIINVRYQPTATPGREPPLLTTAAMTVYYEGPMYGYTMSAKDGSRYLNTDTGVSYMRKAGAWVPI